MLASLIALTTLFGADSLAGTVTGAHGTPLAACFIGLYDEHWQPLGSATSNESGAFSLAAAPSAGLLQIQPLRKQGVAGLSVFAWQPRVFALSVHDTVLNVSVPPAVTYVIAAYGDDGKLMHWKDWEARGKYGAQFLYATDAALRAQPALVYPVYGELTNGEEGGRPSGVPAVLVEPGQEIELHALFWQTKGYGKLQLSAALPPLASAGKSLLVNWNFALAQSAIARARENHFDDPNDKEWFKPYASELDALELHLPNASEQLATPEEAAAADEVLAQALDVADRAAIDRAKRRALLVRNGYNAQLDGVPTEGVAYERPAFLFGAYQGSPFQAAEGKPYAAEPAYQAARDGGFRLATVLPAWGWAGPFVSDAGGLERTFGPEALSKMGYTVKAHGICWLQDFMDILPPEKRTLPHEQIIQGALNYQQELLDAWAPNVDLWEAINEPATTNAVGLSREEMIAFMKRAAANITAKGKFALVNSPHEFNYGTKFDVYTLDGKPLNGYPDTFAGFLDDAARVHALDDVSILGLQVYPGFHLAGGEPGKPFEGPAWTPAFFERVLDIYARFRKTIHITEFSVPSSYGEDWKAGYWKKPWDETTQADYAEAIYTIAYGHPNVQSIGWWDISDEKPSVVTGGLLHADRSPKPVFDRLSHFITTVSHPEADPKAKHARLPGGIYSALIDGKQQEVTVIPGTAGE